MFVQLDILTCVSIAHIYMCIYIRHSILRVFPVCLLQCMHIHTHTYIARSCSVCVCVCVRCVWCCLHVQLCGGISYSLPLSYYFSSVSPQIFKSGKSVATHTHTHTH